MLKLLLFLSLACFPAIVIAQAPQKFNYQGVARNSSGAPISAQLICLRLSIMDSPVADTALYSEVQHITTNSYGMFNTAIGSGTPVSGTMAGISWGSGDKYLKVEMDPTGGSDYTALGTAQLLSVPYALYAATAGGASQAPTGISGSVNYLPRFITATTLGNSSFIDGAEDLLYNKDSNPDIAKIRAVMRSKGPNTSSNLWVTEGAGSGTYQVVVDSSNLDKGFAFGQAAAIYGGTYDSVGFLRYQNGDVSLINNVPGSRIAMYADGRMGNSHNNALWNINTNLDTAGYFTSSSSNLLANGILRAQYTGTALQNQVAVYGNVVPDPMQPYGIGVEGEGGYQGVQAIASNGAATGNAFGVYAVGHSHAAYGVNGVAYGDGTAGSSAYGIYGFASNGATGSSYAGYFQGPLYATSASSGIKAFKIDDPRDPANKFLSHSSVESPDMMDIYNGNITTDAGGLATVTLPDYFETLNKDFRYQLTAIGSFARIMVKEKINGNKFTIQTDVPNTEVSWQVTGIRKDPVANAGRIQVVTEKNAAEKGKYLNPEVYGQPAEQGIGYNPAKAAGKEQPLR